MPRLTQSRSYHRAIASHRIPFDFASPLKHARNMNKLTTAKRVRVVAALVEGNSVRATCHMTGVLRERC
jgi:hypothetical protein